MLVSVVTTDKNKVTTQINDIGKAHNYTAALIESRGLNEVVSVIQKKTNNQQ